MDGDNKEQNSPSPWDRLPIHIWEKIFSLLPISTLAISTSVCRPWRSVIQSPPFMSLYPSLPRPYQDLYFVLFSGSTPDGTLAAAYHPFDDRWVSFSLPAFSCPSSCCSLRRVHASGGAHLLVEQKNGSVVVYNLFTRRLRTVAPMISIYFAPYALGLIEEGPTKYKMVAVSTVDRVHSQVYDSETGCWMMKGLFPGRFAVLGNSVYLDGTLYCLSRAPDYVLAFVLDAGVWSLVNVAVPALVCSHILAHEGALLLVGGVEEWGEISRIGIWELDWREKRWKEVCFMPDGLFRRFSGYELNHFETVDRRGIICLCNTATYNVLMCDLSRMRWWRPVPCPFQVPRNNKSWLGHALEPRIEVLGNSD